MGSVAPVVMLLWSLNKKRMPFTTSSSSVKIDARKVG